MTSSTQADQPTESPRCPATTKKGTPCRATSVLESGLCLFHDPRLEAEREAWRYKGGKNSSSIARAESALLASPNISTLVSVLVDSLVGVKSGELEPAKANSVASLSRALLASMEVAAEQARLARLERLLDQLTDDAIPVESVELDEYRRVV